MHNPSRLTPLSKALMLSQMFRSRPSMAAMGLALCMPVASQAQETAADGSTTTGTVNLAPTAIDSQYLGTATDGTGSYTTGAVSIGKGAPQSLRETPQSVSVVTRQVMDDNNLNSLS
ncbi:TonB-dependent siderophore receptor, partial [Pseudomonas amygdali pv. mori str. 301020]